MQHVGWLLFATLVALLTTLPAQAQSVVAENQATSGVGVAAVQAQLEGQRQYTIQIDGPSGVPFNATAAQVYLGPTAGREGSGQRSYSFQGTTPYEAPLTAPGTGLRYWSYSLVVEAQQPVDGLTVRILDQGTP